MIPFSNICLFCSSVQIDYDWLDRIVDTVYICNLSRIKYTKFLFFSYTFLSCKTTIEAIHGLMSQVIKDKLFNQINTSAN